MTRIPLILSLLALFASSVSAQNTWYVPDDFSTIQAGIDGVANGDTVIVRSGTYFENINFNGMAITVKSEHGSATTIIDANHAATAVRFSNNESYDSIFEGFTVRNGQGADGGGVYCVDSSPTLKHCMFVNNAASNSGGGMLCENSSSPNVENCTFANNTAGYGGGIFARGAEGPTFANCIFTNNQATFRGGGACCYTLSSSSFENCTFSNNIAGEEGGGMECAWASSPTLRGCLFSGNSSLVGGGMVIATESTPLLEYCTFSNNTATNEGGGIWCAWASDPILNSCTIEANMSGNVGGGMAITVESSPIVTNCVFKDNEATNQGGGIWCAWTSTPTLVHCEISGNTGGSGGGMFSSSSSPVLEGCNFTGNLAVYNGGGLESAGSATTLKKCTFTENEASGGGGIFFIYDSRESNGNDLPPPTVENCTFAKNIARLEEGGGIYCAHASSPIVSNTIFRENGSTALFESHSGNFSVNYSNVQGGWLGIGNINADPLFVDLLNNDLHLQETSPCIDAGDPTSSFDSDGTIRDMGAFYFDQYDSDFDNDGLLNDDEIALYGTDPSLFDSDNDGLGDGQELGVTNAMVTDDTNLIFFKEDKDPSTTTDPLNSDTDGGGMSDGDEDFDHNGAFTYFDFDPNDSGDDTFSLQSSALISGQPATLSLSDHRTGSTIAVIYSLSGTGTTSTPFGFDLGLASPVTALPYQVVFTTSSTQVVSIPPAAPSGLSVWMQGVEKLFFGDFFRLTTVLATQIQ